MKVADLSERFVANVVLVDQEWLKLGAALSCQINYSAATSDDRFDFSRNDDDCAELARTPKAKGFKPKNTKLSNSWALKIYSEWATATVRREHMDESNLTEMTLLTDNRDALCEDLCKFVVGIRKSHAVSIARSLEGLRKYERVTAEQELKVSSRLSAPGNHLKHNMQQERGPPSDGSPPLSLAGCSFSG